MGNSDHENGRCLMLDFTDGALVRNSVEPERAQ
jgi:hypothetical protein